MNTKYAKLPARLRMHTACDKAIRSFLGLTLDGDAPRTIIGKICCKGMRLFSHFTVRIVKKSAREKYLEWSRGIFFNFLKKEFAAELELYKTLPLLPTSPDGKIASSAECPRTIWTLWWQGDEALSDLPRAARVCLKTMRGQEGFSTVVVTRHNVSAYIDISDVLPLYNEGRIAVQFLSDIIRVRLLSKYGGVWCDMGILFLDPTYLSELATAYSFFSNKMQGKSMWYLSHAMWSSYFLDYLFR